MSDSSTLRWQRTLLALCAIGFMLWLFALFSDTMWHGRAGLSHALTPVPFHDRITAVVPGSPAAKAGVEPSDVVDLTAASATDRWRFRFGYANGRSCTYVLHRGQTERRATFTPIRSSISNWWIWTIEVVGTLGALFFATIIAWRRPWLVEARVLCLLLLTWVLSRCLATNFFFSPWAGLDAAAAFGFMIAINSNVGLIVAYSLLFGHPVSTIRKTVAALSLLIVALRVAEGVAFLAGIWSAAFDIDWAHYPAGPAAIVRLLMLPVLDVLVIAAVVLAFGAARGRERSLFAWTMALPLLTYLMQAAHDIAVANSAALSHWLSAYDAILQGAGYVSVVSEFLTPFAIGYALLSRSRYSPMTAAAGTMA